MPKDESGADIATLIGEAVTEDVEAWEVERVPLPRKKGVKPATEPALLRLTRNGTEWTLFVQESAR
jgi:hypothetical protein